MAKKMFLTYKAPVDSFPINESRMGLFKKGRYNGFDTMTTKGALDINIGHSGMYRKTNTNNGFAPAFGAIIFGTGIIIHEDSPIDLTVESNSGNNHLRVDIIIAQNNYDNVVGGTPVTYSIIKGPMGGGNVKWSPAPNQVVIGRIYIEPNGFNYNQIRYEKDKAPLPGDLDYTELETLVNTYIDIPKATEIKEGIARIARQVEVDEGNGADIFVTPKTLESKKATSIKYGITRISTNQEWVNGEREDLSINPKQFRGKDRKVVLQNNYTLKPEDIGKVFLGMGTGTIEIYVPAGLGDNVWFGFIAVDSNIKVTATGSGVVIKTQNGRKAETRELNTGMLLESTTSNNYVLLGNLKNV